MSPACSLVVLWPGQTLACLGNVVFHLKIEGWTHSPSYSKHSAVGQPPSSSGGGCSWEGWAAGLNWWIDMGKGNSIGWSIIYREPTGEVRPLHRGGIIGWYGARFRFFAFFFFLKKKNISFLLLFFYNPGWLHICCNFWFSCCHLPRANMIVSASMPRLDLGSTV